MITFGATLPSGTSAADAVRAAEDLTEALAAWADLRRASSLPLLRAGIGVAYGAVVCGAIGDEGRLEFATIGDAVNRAARLQAATKTERVAALVSAEAWQHAIDQGYAPRLPHAQRTCTLAGLTEPVVAVALAHAGNPLGTGSR
jgi:adenylate cyclase